MPLYLYLLGPDSRGVSGSVFDGLTGPKLRPDSVRQHAGFAVLEIDPDHSRFGASVNAIVLMLIANHAVERKRRPARPPATNVTSTSAGYTAGR